MFKVPGHPLGFDRNGNDMLLLLAKGARSSMLVSIGAVFVALDNGTVAGFAGRGDPLIGWPVVLYSPDDPPGAGPSLGELLKHRVRLLVLLGSAESLGLADGD